MEISKGDALISEGDTQDALFIILSGRFRKVKKAASGQEKESGNLSAGDIYGGLFSDENISYDFSIIAETNAKVLSLSDKSLGSLKPELQVFVYKKMNLLSARRIQSHLRSEAVFNDKTRKLNYELRKMAQNEMAVNRRNKSLSEYVKNSFITQREIYEESELVNEVINKIPRLPPYINKLINTLVYENASIDQVVDLALSDPSLSALILKTVNSPAYGLKEKITDMNHAVLYLGFNRVYSLVIESSLKKSMPDSEDFKQIYYHSNIISTLGFEIALLCGTESPVLAGTIGILHDMGKSVVMLLQRNHPKLRLLLDRLDHTMLGGLLLKRWDIPEDIYLALQYQDFPCFLPPAELPKEQVVSVAVLYLSHVCFEALTKGNQNPVEAAFGDLYMKALKKEEISPAELFEIEIMPSLDKKLHTLPKDFRNLIIQYKKSKAEKRS